jgi:hypothetical protein
MLSRLIRTRATQGRVARVARGFGGGHHVKEYDWRDDPKYNPDLVYNPRNFDWKPETYTFPFSHEGEKWWFPYRDHDNSDLSINRAPEFRKVIPKNLMSASHWDPVHDFDHERDFESEDMDVQPDDFKSQHFRKKGPSWQYLAVGILPLLYTFADIVYQRYPDEDYLKKPRHAPMSEPDENSSPDKTLYEISHTKTGRALTDSGHIIDLHYDIVGGKRIFKKFSGVNDSMPIL